MYEAYSNTYQVFKMSQCVINNVNELANLCFKDWTSNNPQRHSVLVQFQVIPLKVQNYHSVTKLLFQGMIKLKMAYVRA